MNKTVFFNATVAKITKDSDGKHATLWTMIDGPLLAIENNEVKSVPSWDDWWSDELLTIWGDSYTKAYKLKNVKEARYKGKDVIKLEVDKLEAIGSTAKKATSYSGIKQGDMLSMTLTGNKEYEEQEDEKTIAELVEQDKDLSTLETALKAADLDFPLDREDKEYTLFAPTNDAFNDLPSGTVADLLKRRNRAKLVSVLEDHVLLGKFTSKELAKRSSVHTLSGKNLKVKKSGSKLMVGNAVVQDADIEASNGVIHTLEQVIACKK